MKWNQLKRSSSSGLEQADGNHPEAGTHIGSEPSYLHRRYQLNVKLP